MIRDYLSHSRLFAGQDDPTLEVIASAAALKKIAKDELVFNEGDPAAFFCVVGKGKVKVFKLSPEGKEQILLIAQPGDSFAEATLYSQAKFPASAQALEDSELVVINRERFISLLAKNPELAVNLIARLSELLRNLTNLIEGLSLSDVTTRVALYLLRLTHSVPLKGVHTLRLPEKKVVLASQLGTIPETLSRSLAKLAREKIIAVEGPEIKILDPNRLKAISRGDT